MTSSSKPRASALCTAQYSNAEVHLQSHWSTVPTTLICLQDPCDFPHIFLLLFRCCCWSLFLYPSLSLLSTSLPDLIPPSQRGFQRPLVLSLREVVLVVLRISAVEDPCPRLQGICASRCRGRYQCRGFNSLGRLEAGLFRLVEFERVSLQCSSTHEKHRFMPGKAYN